MDNKHLQKELHNIFVEEFNESFHNILTISKEEFTHLFIHRMNIILNSYYPKLIPELRKNKILFSKEFKRILEDYYLPCIFHSENIIKKKNLLKNYMISKDIVKIIKKHYIHVKVNF